MNSIDKIVVHQPVLYRALTSHVSMRTNNCRSMAVDLCPNDSSLSIFARRRFSNKMFNIEFLSNSGKSNDFQLEVFPIVG